MKLGRYKHFKGNFYEVIWIARHSETLEELVVYKALYNHEIYGENSLWIRPKSMFLETIVRDWKKMLRFEPIESHK